MLAMTDTKLIEALSNASSLELFELSNIIDRLLADPRRIVAVRQPQQWRRHQRGDDNHEHDAGEYLRCQRVESDMPTASAPMHHKPARGDFCRGDKVSFTDKYLQPQVGTITRINQRTATVDCEGGAGWRVPFAMLRHVMDI